MRIRVRERDDVMLSVKLEDYCEMQRSPQPGVLRTWRGLLSLAIAGIGFCVFGWLVWCVVARIFA